MIQYNCQLGIDLAVYTRKDKTPIILLVLIKSENYTEVITMPTGIYERKKGIIRKKRPVAERFWKKVKINEESGCWEWVGAKNKGYGWFNAGETTEYAHRIAWELTNGKIPDGLLVLHSCDNPKCSNVKHLFLGNHKDNMQDMITKGRARHEGHQGEKNPKAKLTEDDVQKIRIDLKNGVSQKVIGLNFGVTNSNISMIAKNQIWTHLV